MEGLAFGRVGRHVTRMSRIAAAAALWLTGLGMLEAALGPGGSTAVAGLAAGGLALVLGGTLLALPTALDPIARRLATALTGTARGDVKGAEFAAAQVLASELRHREAFERLSRLAEIFPEDVLVYARMLALAHGPLGDAELANSVYARGLRALRSQSARDRLARLQDQYRTGLA